MKPLPSMTNIAASVIAKCRNRGARLCAGEVPIMWSRMLARNVGGEDQRLDFCNIPALRLQGYEVRWKETVCSMLLKGSVPLSL